MAVSDKTGKKQLPDAAKPWQWKPGCPSPNPAGRPKGSLDFWARIRAKAKEKVKEGPHKGREYLDLMADAFIKGVISGEWNPMKEFIEREEGKVPDRIAGPDGGPPVVKVVKGVSMDDLL